ncbi:MAG: glycoside hydrolase family 3 protein [Propionibacteriaceae bacterium]|jgi:beta-N-acetylhexosaminidase|nr:glycoside hydrolase family 3 protein [Propionibacteriaceae bacterium]
MTTPISLAPAAQRHLAAMSEEELVGQLLCIYHLTPTPPETMAALDAVGVRPGGVLVMNRPAAELRQHIARYQDWNPTPMLVAANLESGTRGTVSDGTVFANPMQIGATADPIHATRLGEFCARHGKEVGVNWGFAPVVDLTYNHRNPITNTRAFGSDPELVAAMGAAYVRALQAGGVAASVKHFPGDGVDERDQHLVTSVNSFSFEHWDETYGQVYRAMVAADAWTAMVGHIALPDWARRHGVSGKELYLPGPLSQLIITELLRGHLGYRGMVVSDNAMMAGFTRVMPREQAVVQAINAGCDMILSSLNTVEDYQTLLAAVRSGALSAERLLDAVRHTMAVKQAVGLFGGVAGTDAEAGAVGAETVPNLAENQSDAARDGVEQLWLREVAERSITLAKQRDDVLPLTPERYPKVLVYVIDETTSFYDATFGFGEHFVARLEELGFQVVRRDVPAPDHTLVGERAIQAEVNLVIYFSCLRFDSVSNTSRVRWSHPQGPEALRTATVPVLGVSVADPYLLQDMPSLGTLVNGYCPTIRTVDAVVERITGRAEFTGVSPVDQFCGYEDARV